MARHPKKLKVFGMADALVVEVYTLTRQLPVEERFGLQSQLRRAAMSVPVNIVEGCARRSTADHLRFLGIALGSASEVHYLLGLGVRLDLLPTDEVEPLAARYDEVKRYLQRLIDSLDERALS
jgi:four helix bundle protein